MKYPCLPHRPVDADSMSQAAEIFAARMARRKYGKSGRVAACRVDGYTPDGRTVDAEAFIGYRAGDGTAGNNVRFTMHLR